MSATEYWKRPRGAWYMAPAYSVRELPAWIRFLVRAWEAWRANRWTLEDPMIRAGALVAPEGGYYQDARPWWDAEDDAFPDYYSRRQLEKARRLARRRRRRWPEYQPTIWTTAYPPEAIAGQVVREFSLLELLREFPPPPGPARTFEFPVASKPRPYVHPGGPV